VKFGVKVSLNKFAAKTYKRFPPHLNNVFTQPRETYYAYVLPLSY